MNRLSFAIILALVAGGVQTLYPKSVLADSLTIMVSGKGGTLYDISARHLGHHLAKQLPDDASVVVQNFFGENNAEACRKLMGENPDGKTIGLLSLGIIQMIIPGNPAFKSCDLSKLTVLGASNTPTRVVLFRRGTYKTEGENIVVETTADTLKLRGKKIYYGVSISGGLTSVVVGNLLKTLNIGSKEIAGYGGNAEQNICKGELDLAVVDSTKYPYPVCPEMTVGVCQYGNLTADRKLVKEEGLDLPLCLDLMAQFGNAASPEYELVSVVTKLVMIGNPLFGPPNLPMEETAKLRDVLEKAHRHPAFIASIPGGKKGVGNSFIHGELFSQTLAAWMAESREKNWSEKYKALVQR
jgi:hypothetical protein